MPWSWQLSHLVNNSWWPLSMSMSVFSFMSVILFWFKYSLPLIFLLLLTVNTFFLLFGWFRDVTRESLYQGSHTELVQGGLKWGLLWFLFSEVWFFFSIFWSFFHFSMAPISSGSGFWPNLGLIVIPPFQVPLLNTVILLMSGMTATLAHQELVSSKNSIWILISVILGVYFLILQGVEYTAASYTISSGSYGGIFFFGTGFHGLHVFLGAILLMTSVLRLNSTAITAHHHFGVEFSLWYWHFVDVVWLFLFFWVYTWGS